MSGLKEKDNSADMMANYFRENWGNLDTETKMSTTKVVRGDTTPLDGTAGVIHRLAEAYEDISTFQNLPDDAASEKDRGNEYFKKGEYSSAIGCYTRSIAVQPTAVAFANRAMAEIKLKQFPEAESDCCEAIDLDSRYTKAYSRRGTARRQLGKFFEAAEDFEFALSLEPDSKELQKSLKEIEAILSQQGLKKEKPQEPPMAARETRKLGKDQKAASRSRKDEASAEQLPGFDSTRAPQNVSEKPSVVIGPSETKSRSVTPPSSNSATSDFKQGTMDSSANGKNKMEPLIRKVLKEEKKAVAQGANRDGPCGAAAVERASAEAKRAILRNIPVPKNAYEFELLWKGVGGDLTAQGKILKRIEPATYPNMFKNDLSASALMEILMTVQSEIVREDAMLAFNILEGLTKVPRFDVVVMFLTAKQKQGILPLWEDAPHMKREEMNADWNNLRLKFRL